MKRILKVIGVGIITGIVCVYLLIKFDIPVDHWNRYIGIFGVVVISGAVIFRLLHNPRYKKKMNEAVKLLEEGKAKEYIEAVEAMAKKEKLSSWKNATILSLPAGYCSLKEYEKAVEILESLFKAHFFGKLKTIHLLSLCICYFHTNQGKKAMELYEKNQKRFKALRKSKLYGGNIAVLDAFVAIEKREFARANELLKYAIEEWKNPRLQESYRNLVERLQRKQSEGLQ